MSYIQSARGSSQREIKVPARSRLYQIDLLQKERSNLEAKIRTQLLKLDVLLEDQRRDELLNEVDTLESLFAEYLKSHSKCHMLIVNAENPDEFDRYSTDSIDRKVSTIKKRVIEVMDQEIVEERGERSKTAYRPEEIAEQLRELPFDKASSIVSSRSSSKRSSNKSGKSSKHSGKSSNKSNKSVSSEKAREKARLAGLQIEAKFLQQRQKIEQESKAFQLNLEMAKSQAKIEAYENVEQEHDKPVTELEKIFPEVDKSEFVDNYVNSYEVPEENVDQSSEVPPKEGYLKSKEVSTEVFKIKSEMPRERYFKSYEVPKESYYKSLEAPKERHINSYDMSKEKTTLHQKPKIAVETGVTQNDEVKQTQQTASHDQCANVGEILRHIQAPPIELDVFSGNIIDYPNFIATFTEVVDSTVTNPRGRLVRLIQCLKDEAKELAESCNHLPPAEGYARARHLLDNQYGDRYRILSHYRQELKQWPKLRSSDAKGFRRFYSFLMKYKATMLAMKSSNLADNPEIIQKLQLILPPHLQERWNRKSYQVRKNRHIEAGLDEFISFVEEETALINDPNYSRLALQDFKEETTPRQGQKKGKDFKSLRTSAAHSRCPMCEETHDLDKCEKYLQLSVNERRKWLYKKQLCFSCYNPSNENHQARSCTKKRKCETCKGDHPTGLHGFRRRPKPPDRRRGNQDEQT